MYVVTALAECSEVYSLVSSQFKQRSVIFFLGIWVCVLNVEFGTTGKWSEPPQRACSGLLGFYVLLTRTWALGTQNSCDNSRTAQTMPRFFG